MWGEDRGTVRMPWPATGLVYDIITSNTTARLGIARTTTQLMRIGAVFKLVALFLEEVYDLTRIESQVASIRRKHALSITTLRHIRKIAFLKSNKCLLLEAKNL